MASKELIKDCLRNKTGAQRELYNLYASNMLGVCYRYTKSIEDAEDVLQEGFIKVFTKLDQFNHDGELGAWIRRIMVNTAINYLQKHNRYKKQMQVDDMKLHPVSDENPEINLDTKDLVEMIVQLPSGYQTIFNLVAVEGYDHVEVSKILGMNINTVRSQYSRARAMLVARLQQYSESTKLKQAYSGKI
jgi:RNA polymerase sigma factor (sigma-70 family)